jgi:AraC-like DNA-binding protein
MSLIVEQRLSDSPYVETITRGRTIGSSTPIRPAEISWHLVFVKTNDIALSIAVGPLTGAGTVSITEGAEILWIRFKPGTFMPRLPFKSLLNTEIILPETAGSSLWLDSTTWERPDFENADTFVDRLVRDEVLLHDPLIGATLQGKSSELAERTLRHRFLHTTGLTQGWIRQMRRAQEAEAMLRRGVSILDTTHALGYYDQPHLTRSLRQFIGYTPAQIVAVK